MPIDPTAESRAKAGSTTVGRPLRRGVLGLLGAAAVAAAGLTFLASGLTSAPGLPDMVSEAPGPPRTQIYRDGRLLIRFDGYVTNDVSAAEELEIRALDPNAQGVMQTVEQRVNGQVVSPPAPGRTPVVRFEEADGHRHYHLKHAAEYSLWTPDESRQVALAQKTEAGFCLEDTFRNGGNRPAAYSASFNDFCLQVDFGEPFKPGPLTMGITPGFRDVYYDGLSYQWIDASDVAPGRYRLASRVDPTDVISESNESNNGNAFRDAVVPGHLPRAVSVPRVDPGRTAPIVLSAERFTSDCFPNAAEFSPDPADVPYCDPGPVRFRITSVPARGTLTQGGAALVAGSVLTSGAISYSPNPGQRGADSFTYEAYDANKPTYPRARPQAAVAIQVGAPITSVAISGAQPSIVAGLSMQLSAVVTNGPSGVAWSASAGSITSSGLFTAPSTPGVVTVRATSIDDPSVAAGVSIRVDAAQAQAPAPTIAPKRLVKRFRVGRVGRRLVVAKMTAGPYRGRLRTTATLGRKVVARCTRPVRPNRTVICKLRLKRAYNLKRVRVTAKFTSGRKTAVRRAFVIRRRR